MRLALPLLACLLALPVRAEPRAVFAVIVGVNQAVDDELPPLRYADDDAARYHELFRTLGARTYLLARLDENTARLHPQALAEAALPREAEFRRALRTLAADVEHAAGRGVEAEVFFVYAGHGNVRDAEGYVSLEDARLTGAALSKALLEGSRASRVHVIIDACFSYFLAYGRGPGGERRPLPEGFSQTLPLATDPRVGLLLSTSSARESHEWEGVQAGVFSHEIRSGLFGGADVDGDGAVSYREIASFVDRANASIPNERFRPEVWARPPRGTERLVDLSPGMGRRLTIDGAHGGRYLLEDHRGVRLADFHPAPGQAVRVLRPAPLGGRLYLRRVADDQEYALPTEPDVVALADLPSEAPRSLSRGAAHDAFSLLFALPFDHALVQQFVYPEARLVHLTASWSTARKAGIGVSFGAGALLAAGGATSFLLTRAERERPLTLGSHLEASERNGRIEVGNVVTVSLLCVAAAAVVTGTVLTIWPTTTQVQLAPTPGGAVAGVSGRF